VKLFAQLKRHQSVLCPLIIILTGSLYLSGCEKNNPDHTPEMLTLPNSGWLAENDTSKELAVKLKERNTEILGVDLRWGTRQSIHDRNKLKNEIEATRSTTRDEKGFYSYQQSIEQASDLASGIVLDYQFKVRYRPRGKEETLTLHGPLQSIVTSTPGANMTLLPQQVNLMVGEKERLEIMIHPPVQTKHIVHLEVQPKGKVKLYNHDGDKVDQIVFNVDDVYQSLIVKATKGNREGLPVTITATALGLPTEVMQLSVRK
jgi:hypothetical protein